MKNTISQKYIKDYIRDLIDIPFQRNLSIEIVVFSSVRRMAKACKIVAKIYGYTPKQIFHFMVEQTSLSGTHSYGFNTAYGREIREEFEVQYHEMYKEI